MREYLGRMLWCQECERVIVCGPETRLLEGHADCCMYYVCKYCGNSYPEDYEGQDNPTVVVEEPKPVNMRFGMALSKGRFVWAMDTWYSWIPGQGLVVKVWNKLACWRWGHDDMLWHLADVGHIPRDEAACISCCKLLTKCVGGHGMMVVPDFTGPMK